MIERSRARLEKRNARLKQQKSRQVKGGREIDKVGSRRRRLRPMTKSMGICKAPMMGKPRLQTEINERIQTKAAGGKQEKGIIYAFSRLAAPTFPFPTLTPPEVQVMQLTAPPMSKVVPLPLPTMLHRLLEVRTGHRS